MAKLEFDLSDPDDIGRFHRAVVADGMCYVLRAMEEELTNLWDATEDPKVAEVCVALLKEFHNLLTDEGIDLEYLRR